MTTTMVEIKQKTRLGRVRLSLDRKVTPYAVQKGEQLNNEISRGIRNTFGLPAGISCQEGMTKFCDDCYASSIEDIPSVMDKMWHNWMTISKVMHSSDELLRLFEPMVAECIDDYERLNVPRDKWIFRHLWDGDIPSVAFLDALMRLADSFTDVKFWVYTRSFGYVREWLSTSNRFVPDNFKLYLSVDKYNKDRLRELNLHIPSHEYRYAFCGNTFAETTAMARHMGLKPQIKCPEQADRLDLVEWVPKRYTDRGKRIGEGACSACGWCVEGKGNVQFAVHPKLVNKTNDGKAVG